MEVLEELKKDITSESVAYGYTLSVWGSGALVLTGLENVTPLTILGFATGAVFGFAFLALLVYRHLFTSIENPDPEFVVASMIHLFSSLGTLVISYLLVTNLTGLMGTEHIAMLVGLNATVSYNIGLLVEEFVSFGVYRSMRPD